MQGIRRLALGSLTAALALSVAHASGPDARSRRDPTHAGAAVVRLVDLDRLLAAKAALAPALEAPAPAVRHLVDVRGLLKEPGTAPLGAPR